MIKFPPEFTALIYPGYFWNVRDKKLYSVKVNGILKPLKLQRAHRYNHYVVGYQISVDGNKRYVPLDKLLKVSKVSDSIFPVQLKLF